MKYIYFEIPEEDFTNKINIYFLDIFYHSALLLKDFVMLVWFLGMIGIDSNGNIGAGTSTNGASHKIPG